MVLRSLTRIDGWKARGPPIRPQPKGPRRGWVERGRMGEELNQNPLNRD